MGISGSMDLASSSIPPSSTTTDNPGTPIETGDAYTFEVDFSLIGETFVMTGDFDFVGGGTETGYSATEQGFFPGTFNIDPTNGTFTYTVTASQVSASGLTSHTVNIEGTDSIGSYDLDTVNFNFTLCFAPGTGITTPEGETAVEALKIGDAVLTAEGHAVPVKWVGRTTVSPMFKPADRLEPVCIAAGALAEGVPHRDLTVTADHGMVLCGMVITAGALVNDETIRLVDWRAFGESVTYYHVETEDHDVILANGAPAETYVDYVARSSFDNHAEYLALYGEERTIPEMCLPRISAARQVPSSLRKRLVGRQTSAA